MHMINKTVPICEHDNIENFDTPFSPLPEVVA